MSERHRAETRWLSVLSDTRTASERANVILDRLADTGLLEETDLARLRPLLRQEAVSDAVNQLTRWRVWPSVRRPASLVFPAVLTTTCLVAAHALFGRGHRVHLDVIAAAVAVVSGFLVYGGALTVLDSITSGPELEWMSLLPAVDPDAAPYRFRLARFWWLDDRALTNGLHIAAPVLGLSGIVALHQHDYVAVGAATALMVGLVWMGLLLLGRLIIEDQFRRVMVSHGRTAPMAELAALGLFWWLAHAEQARHRGRGGWLRLAAMMTVSLPAERRALYAHRWAQVLRRDRAERQAILAFSASYGATLAAHASAVEAARTAEQRRQVTIAIRDQVRLALAGDTSFLAVAEASPRRPWAWRILGRFGPGLLLAGTAIGLPHLPGVTATGATLVGVQVGLVVAAVLTLVGAPTEVQRSISEALKSTGGVHKP